MRYDFPYPFIHTQYKLPHDTFFSNARYSYQASRNFMANLDFDLLKYAKIFKANRPKQLF